MSLNESILEDAALAMPVAALTPTLRQWATGVLRDFAIRGYVLDKERLKNGAFLSREYYDNLLAEIRESWRNSVSPFPSM